MIFFSCWATYIQIFFGKIHNIVTTTVTNSTNVEPVSYIYIIKPTGCQNNPGRVFPLDASASIPVLVHFITFRIIMEIWDFCLGISLKNLWNFSRLFCGNPGSMWQWNIAKLLWENIENIFAFSIIFNTAMTCSWNPSSWKTMIVSCIAT